MAAEPRIKALPSTRGTRLERSADGRIKMVINLHGAPDVKYAEIEPGYIPGVGPVLNFYRIGITGERQSALILSVNVMHHFIRWFPILADAGRRISRQSRKQSS
jgi:hypothetical protein